jgi:hypothetical protein
VKLQIVLLVSLHQPPLEACTGIAEQRTWNEAIFSHDKNVDDRLLLLRVDCDVRIAWCCCQRMGDVA